MEADACCAGLHTLVLDDYAVMDQQDAVEIQFSRGLLPLDLQAVCAAAIRDLQPGDLSRSWDGNTRYKYKFNLKIFDSK